MSFLSASGFIELLRDYPWAGFLIGLVFFAVMIGSKNLVIYFYAKSQKKKQEMEEKKQNSN